MTCRGGRHCVSAQLLPEGKSLSLSGLRRFQLTMKSSCREKDDTVCSLSPPGTSHLGRDLTSARGITPQSAESARRIDHNVKGGSLLISVL